MTQMTAPRNGHASPTGPVVTPAAATRTPHLVLLNRREEREALDHVLASARDGVGGSLVLRGEPGIGKTSMLEYAVERAADMRVARAAGIESEMALGFAALRQLLIPFLPYLGRLPGPQRNALRAAFGQVTAAAPDLFLVSLAVLTLLADAAAGQPLLVAVDDAQWLDQSTTGVLAFVARRLRACPIAFVVAVREPTGRCRSLQGLPDLHLAGLPERDARELLGSVVAGPLDGRLADRIVAETGGNPLALVELGRELTDGQHAAGALPLQPMPIGGRLEERFLRWVRALPAGTQTLLLLAAAEPSGSGVLLRRAADRLGLCADVAVPAEAAGLLLAAADQVTFRHPLIRSAVYHGAPLGDRQRVHGCWRRSSIHRWMRTDMPGTWPLPRPGRTSSRRANLSAGPGGHEPAGTLQ